MPAREGSPTIVRERRVFFLPGYDPNPPRRYRELYRREGALQSGISGYDLALEPSPGGWLVRAEIDGHAVGTRVEVLDWRDIVDASMRRSIPATYAALGKTLWIYVRSGALWQLARLRRGPIIAALYPLAMLLAQLLFAIGLGIGAGWAIADLAGQAVPGWLFGMMVAWTVLRWFKAQDGWFFAHYLTHDFAFTASEGGAYPRRLEERLACFRRPLADALQSGADEVLIVGHSSGAHLAVSLCADLLREIPDARLSLLTLGQAIPMVSFLQEAHRLRRDLHDLAGEERLTWVDVTAPGDGCTFALCDPVSVSGVAPAQGKRWPLVISAAFSQTLSADRWARLRRRYFRLHFQYLCAFDRPGDYDYFRITAGPLPLGERFAARAPSASRIDVPLSPWVGRAA